MRILENLKEEIRDILTPYHVVVPTRPAPGRNNNLLSYTCPHSIVSEQFNVMKINLLSLTLEKPPYSLVITSANPGEGKTVTAANLAYKLSLDKSKKTLLIDCDLRKPGLHDFFNLSKKGASARTPGFTEILQGSANIKDLIKNPVLGDLFFIPAGAPADDPTTLLNKDKIKTTLDELKTLFDYIIFDSPPVLAVTDARILGTVCDSVILVIKSFVTQKEDIEEAYNTLALVKAAPKACILTSLPAKRTNKYGSYFRN